MQAYSLNCNGRLLLIDTPIVMGILNATPDSFYTKGKNFTTDAMTDQAGKMIEDGATILDIGAISTRPGSVAVDEQEELERLLPILRSIRKKYPNVFISVDTYRSNVAKVCISEGADMINDISAGELDNNMMATIGALNVPYIAMHMQGNPTNMQENPTYNNVTRDVLTYCINKLIDCRNFGIKDIIIDPGFGFGKTLNQNYQLLKELNTFSILDTPILVGISRKSMIYKLLNISPEEALNGTTVLNYIAIANGANILRVHDVKEAVQVIKTSEHFSKLTKI